MLIGHRRERFKGPLYDALRADIDPTARRHLAVHHQALALELMKMIPVGPGADQIRICDQHSWGIFVRAKDADGFTGLNQQRLVIFQVLQ